MLGFPLNSGCKENKKTTAQSKYDSFLLLDMTIGTETTVDLL